ncbi:MAG: hypothetical protein V5A38_04740 [Halolamina sp.]
MPERAKPRSDALQTSVSRHVSHSWTRRLIDGRSGGDPTESSSTPQSTTEPAGAETVEAESGEAGQVFSYDIQVDIEAESGLTTTTGTETE